MTHRWLDRTDELDDLVDHLVTEPRYALDTEFHRERTYFPRLALVQLAWPGDLVLVDPLRVDTAPFARLFASPALAVAHAAQQDLDVLRHAVGEIPSRLFDTQVAAGFVGYGTPSLSSLVQGELGTVAIKGDRLTDWLHRPLTRAQCEYAASDVAFLLELQDRLVDQLRATSRLSWAEDACEELRRRPTGAIAPDLAWTKLKDARSLRPRARAVAQAVAAWREREAAATDTRCARCSPTWPCSGSPSASRPRWRSWLRPGESTIAIEEGRAARAIIAAVVEGQNAPPPTPPDAVEELERAKRPALTLVSAWISQVARASRIDTALLATRADLVAMLRNDPQARLASGWRAELLGDDITRLVDGRAAITFDGQGGLKLIDVAR